MDDERSGSIDTFNDDGMDIPEYVDYISLLYRFACTIFIIGMGSLIISTILKTRSLHNIHNILVVNLMVADIVGILIYAFQNVGMTVSYIIDMQDPFRCYTFHLFQFPLFITFYTIVTLSVEKFIAIKYALRYKAIVTHCRVYQAIAAGWITAPLFEFTEFTYDLVAGKEYDKSRRFGVCYPKQASFVASFFILVVSTFWFFITIIVDTYLYIKAYQMYKKFRKKMERKSRCLRTNLTKFFISSSQ